MGNISIHLLYKKANSKYLKENLKAERSYPPHQKTQQEKLFRYAK